MQIKRFEILHFVFIFNQFYQMSQIASKITMNNIRKFILQLQTLYYELKLYYNLKKKNNFFNNLKAQLCIFKMYLFHFNFFVIL